MKELSAAFAAASDWTRAGAGSAREGLRRDVGKKIGQVAQPLRAALTGTTVSPPVFDMMVALGRDEALARIADQAV